MGVTRWADIQDKVSPERRAEIKREAIADLDRMGYAALRKARELTQVELADKLGIAQSSVAALEARTDLQLSTLAKYIRAMGGELEIRAVFPEATFHLEPPVPTVAASSKQAQQPSARTKGQVTGVRVSALAGTLKGMTAKTARSKRARTRAA